MKILTCITIVLFPLISFGQGAAEINFFLRDANGRILDGFTNNKKTEGSPYLFTEFCNASIVSARGKKYSSIPSNINLATNELIFETHDKQVMAVNIAIQKAVFENCETQQKKIFLSGFSPIDKLTERSFYELLDSGTVLLLKSYQVLSSESRAYNESVETVRYDKVSNYYLFLPATGLVKMPRSITDIPLLLDKDHKEKLAAFIRSNQLKSKNESDLIKLMSFYRTL